MGKPAAIGTIPGLDIGAHRRKLGGRRLGIAQVLAQILAQGNDCVFGVGLIHHGVLFVGAFYATVFDGPNRYRRRPRPTVVPPRLPGEAKCKASQRQWPDPRPDGPDQTARPAKARSSGDRPWINARSGRFRRSHPAMGHHGSQPLTARAAHGSDLAPRKNRKVDWSNSRATVNAYQRAT